MEPIKWSPLIVISNQVHPLLFVLGWARRIDATD